MAPPTRDLSKLPKWAQDRIRTLERDRQDLQNELARGPEGSNTFLEPYTRERTPLGENPTIVFVLPDGEEITCSLRGHVPGDVSSIHLSVAARDGFLQLSPQSSNVVRVRATTNHAAY